MNHGKAWQQVISGEPAISLVLLQKPAHFYGGCSHAAKGRASLFRGYPSGMISLMATTQSLLTRINVKALLMQQAYYIKGSVDGV